MPKPPEILFKKRNSDIIVRDKLDGFYGVDVVMYRQHNWQWRFFVVYNGRILHTGRGESQAQAHTFALIYLRSRGFHK